MHYVWTKLFYFVWLGHPDQVLIIEESIIADETPSAFIRQISLKKVMVEAQLSKLSFVFDSCFLCWKWFLGEKQVNVEIMELQEREK